MFRELNVFWEHSGSGVFTRGLIPRWTGRVLVRRSYSRRSSTFYWRVLTGHSSLRVFQHRIGICESSFCRCGCSSDETLEHVLFDYAFYVKHRLLLMKEIACEDCHRLIDYFAIDKHRFYFECFFNACNIIY